MCGAECTEFHETWSISTTYSATVPTHLISPIGIKTNQSSYELNHNITKIDLKQKIIIQKYKSTLLNS